ncbi:MAG: dihydropteroate synthase [Deltaproteobacteria bacterium]|nr:dihydropteroate synthase [Deltaproteobacteria bacterium]
MSVEVRCLELLSLAHGTSEMKRIGVDPVGAALMAPKQFHYNLLLKAITPPQANILKQEILAIGGEAAVSKGVAACRVKVTDVLVSGTLKELRLLVKKLRAQPYGLKEVSASIEEVIKKTQKEGTIFKGSSFLWNFNSPRDIRIMGVLNITPDSFSSDGALYKDIDKTVLRAEEMVRDGADIIDVGGESTRPGAEPVSEAEEIKRVLPVIRALKKKGILVSVDTTKASVARVSIDEGVDVINDISAMEGDKDMAGLIKDCTVGVVLMHSRGMPKTMQADTNYTDIVGEVFSYLNERINFTEELGIEKSRIAIDPGIGFGKSTEGNLEILRRLKEFSSIGSPLLIGTSRKSFIGNITGVKDARQRLSGTIASISLALGAGARIIRVHDVLEAREALSVAGAVLAEKSLTEANQDTGEPEVVL